MDEASVFLSYARGDDEPFVRRLYCDLVAMGFDVWFDRVDLPSRQLTFHQEIKDAIRARARLLLVAGPQAASSEYVREECLFALESEKPVLPVLRSGGFDDVPACVGKVHCEDFRDDAAYRAQLLKLVANLRRPRARLGALWAVPELPRNHVARRELLQRVKETLLADVRAPVVVTGAAARTGLHGMGGIGKSLLAAAVARDPDVRRAYPDGAIWLHCGPRPDPLRLQRQIVAALGGEATFCDETQGRGVAREVLLNKAVLLVFDDVAQAAHVTQVAELGPRCRALVTTRDAGVLRNLQCAMVPVDLLDDEQSLQLLADATALGPDSLGPDARAVAAECGRLPLALALCAGLVRGASGLNWADVLDALRHAQLDEIADDQVSDARHRSLHATIQASVDLLAPDERRRWAEVSVFARDMPVPVTAVCLFWASTGGLGGFAGKRLLARLAERSLLDLVKGAAADARDAGEAVSMHDLLLDYAAGIAGDRTTLHRRFADAAWAAYQAQADVFHGYVRDRLPRHLVAAGDPQRLLEAVADAQLDYFQLWAEQGLVNEGVECLEFLVRWLRTTPGRGDLVRSLATQVARLHNRRGDDASASTWLDVALEKFQGGAPADRADAVALHEAASVALARGDYRRACAGYRRALRVVRRLGAPAGGEIAANLIGLAAVNNFTRQHPARTIRLARLALENAASEQDAPHMAEACRLLADEHNAEMQYAQGERYLAQGLAIARQAGLSAARVSLLTAQAWMACQRAELEGDPPGEAEQSFRELVQLAAADADWRLESDAWSGLGLVALLRADEPLLDQAINRLTALLAGRRRPAVEARLRLFDATRAYGGGRFAEAAKQFDSAAAYCVESGLLARQADALVGRTAALLACGETAAAAACRTQAEEILERCPRVRQVIARACLEAGRCAGLRRSASR